MRHSKYWDDFERRAEETVNAVLTGSPHTVRRVACFITDRCNFRCKYCNGSFSGTTMDETVFYSMLANYGDTAIIHITGGEPSTVPWLYPIIEEFSDKYRFHLNTNAYITPPSKYVRRLKVSLDSCNRNEWNKSVGRNAFDVVVKNIQDAIPNTVVSLTYTLSHQNYKDVVDFARFCNAEFPGLYALFFSVYKGTDKRFVLTPEDTDNFFERIIPELVPVLNNESASLINETIDEKRRLMQGIRFEQNCTEGVCFLSMTERVLSPDGQEYTCSHLYRDGIFMKAPIKVEKCRYGCNQRLVKFNDYVCNMVNGSKIQMVA